MMTTRRVRGWVALGLTALAAAAGCASAESEAESRTADVFTMQIASVDSGATASCLAYEDEQWKLVTVKLGDGGTTGSTDGCVLFAARVAGEVDAYWVSGKPYDIELRGPDFDGDPVRHSTSTAEDPVRAGTFPMRVLPVEGDFDRDPAIWAGELEVVAVSSARDWVRVSLRRGT